MAGASSQSHDDLRFSGLAERLGAGDATAETLVVRRFTVQLVALARRQMADRIRQKSPPEEAVQSAFGSFFKRLRRGQFDLTSWDALWSLLVVITVRKCSSRRAYFLASRRDVRREIVSPTLAGDIEHCGIPLSREPHPDEALALTELVERLLCGLSDGEQQIVRLRLEGYSIGEICQLQGRSDRTVRRILARARHRALRLTEVDKEQPIRTSPRATG
ncbi:MAG: sigma-70 family RNA polymerase sigma factor [Planctomycetia bacterium]|nr:sigma-70 family RNA polymerase sigma factor [Planctomycetia bacterium]